MAVCSVTGAMNTFQIKATMFNAPSVWHLVTEWKRDPVKSHSRHCGFLKAISSGGGLWWGCFCVSKTTKTKWDSKKSVGKQDRTRPHETPSDSPPLPHKLAKKLATWSTGRSLNFKNGRGGNHQIVNLLNLGKLSPQAFTTVIMQSIGYITILLALNETGDTVRHCQSHISKAAYVIWQTSFGLFFRYFYYCFYNVLLSWKPGATVRVTVI